MAISLKEPLSIYQRVAETTPLLEQHPPYKLGMQGGGLKVPQDPSLDLSVYTVEIFLKTARYADDEQRILVKGTGGYDYNWHTYINPNSNIIRVQIHSTVDSVLTYLDVPFEDDVPLQLAASFERPDFVVYKNGAVHDSTVFDHPHSTTSANLYIGIWRDEVSDPLFGELYHVRIYDRVLSLRELQHNLNNPLSPVRSGLRLWLAMLEGQGTTVADLSGYGNNATFIAGTITWRNCAKHEVPASIT